MSWLNLSLKYDHLKYVWYAGLPSAEKLFEVSAHSAVAGPEEGPGEPAPISRCGSGTARALCVNGKHPFKFLTNHQARKIRSAKLTESRVIFYSRREFYYPLGQIHYHKLSNPNINENKI